MGISMGVPYFQVKDIFKKAHVTVFSSHFALYRDLSQRVFSVVAELLPSKEQYSIDEAFFTFRAATPEQALRELRQIKAVVERRVGIPVSIGLAATKTQAKYANRLAKKGGGVVVLSPSDWQAKMAAIPLTDLWGVGGRLSTRYRAAKISTVADLLDCPRPRIDSLFGIAGLRLQAELRGEVMYPVGVSTAAQKSTTSSRSFKHTTEDLSVLKDAVAYHIRQAAADLRRLGLVTSALQVSIQPGRHSDFFLHGGSQVVPLLEPTADTAVLLKAAMQLTEQLFEGGVPYKKAGITFTQLTSVAETQGSLFTPTASTTTATLMATIDELNGRFGQQMVQLGRQTGGRAWSPSQGDLSPAYTTNWSMVPVVQSR